MTSLKVLGILITWIIALEGAVLQTKYGNWTVARQMDSIPSGPSFMVDEQNKQFLLDGKPFRYISGSIHYFRIPESQWDDRLQKVRALGFNAIQYYIPWNMHELEEGKYDFSGLLDFGYFSMMAQKYGMWTLLRLGPYICGEWENGGLPWWLLNKNVTKQRSSDPVFMQEVEKWFNVLLPRVKPLLRKNGGPILMLQIENEYGSYDACDKKYTSWLRDLVRKHVGDDVLLYTTDGSGENYLKCGAVDGVLPTVDFGPTEDKTRIQNYFEVQRKFDPTAPLVNSEYYPGWLVLWGQKKQELPSTKTIMQGAQYMYEMGANINFYMIHGGTNFGFWNGAETEASVITSYDYTAPLSEAGDITPNYLELRKWVKTLPDWPVAPLDVPTNQPKRAYGKVKLRRVHSVARFIEEIDTTCIEADKPMSFEKLEHPLGYVVYHAKIDSCGNLTIPSFADFAYVYVNGQFMGTLTRQYYDKKVNSVMLDGCGDEKHNVLFILVENQGRKTFETINDYKGILSDVYVNDKIIHGWTQCGLELPLRSEDVRRYTKHARTMAVQKIRAQSNQNQGVYVGVLEVDKPSDTWIDTTGWGKGLAIVNGHNLGRYWPTEGPQMTLYVPAEFLKHGSNLVMFVELEGGRAACPEGSACITDFIDHPVFVFE